MQSAGHGVERIDHDRGAADRAEELAFDLSGVGRQERAADRLRLASRDVAEQRDHRADAIVPAQRAAGDIIAEYEAALAFEIRSTRVPRG